MKNPFRFGKKKESNEFKIIDGIIKLMNTLKNKIDVTIYTLTDDQTYKDIVNNDNEGFTKRIDTINESRDIMIRNIKDLIGENAKFTFINEIQIIKKPITNNREELRRYYTKINEILPHAIQALVKLRNEKTLEKKD